MKTFISRLALVACALVVAGCQKPRSICNPIVRATKDRPDDSDDFQVHVIYARPKDGFDRHLDTNGEIAKAVNAGLTWMERQAEGRRLRYDTCEGELDVTSVVLPQNMMELEAAGGELVDLIESDLRTLGLHPDNKIFSVYYEGVNGWACAFANPPPGRVGVNVLQATLPTCAGDSVNRAFRVTAQLHEIFHVLGAVPSCAPHRNSSGFHVYDDPHDLMYPSANDDGQVLLDPGRDDYFDHHNEGCPDVAKMVFMEPTPEGAVLPPQW